MPALPPFEALYRAHFAYVWRTLCRLGCPRAELADAAQDVFLVAFRKLERFEHRSTLRTWLFGICYRNTLSRCRLAARRAVNAAIAVDTLPDSAPDQARLLELDQRRATLEAILEQLSVEQRAVFTLHELDGVEGAEIAEILDIPIGTAYSRLRSAREVFWKTVARHRAREAFAEPVLAGSR